MGANSATVVNIGCYYVKYTDGTVHKIIPPTIIVTGLTYGNRTFAVTEKMFVVDEVISSLTVRKMTSFLTLSLIQMTETHFPRCGRRNLLAQITLEGR